ncbi:MAG: ATP-dependent Clp protease ATP-binding subunit ClpA [Alphaproteobacteria bacterium ADurb.Bin438]|nr:MAG: ATP-dependent Clp protease ATP-binding subunit ClpA [Alphaproteobacteria bacterium ADurb.Bin438]
MDHGKLTDTNGKQVDFRNTILIMTTNAGAFDLAKPPLGFNKTIREGDDTEALERMFTPEFRNRLDAIIKFQNLSTEVVGMVVDKFINQLKIQLLEKLITVELKQDGKLWLVNKGYDAKNGARPMARVIDEFIKKPLADEMLFGSLTSGGKVLIDVKDGMLNLTFDSLKSKPKPKKEKVKV